MHINRHFDFASLLPLKERWNELSDGVPFRSWEWVEAWWRHYACHNDGRPKRDHELFVLTVWDENNRLVAIAPWYRQVSRSGARVIRFLGDGEVCSDYLSLLCDRGEEQAVAAALADWLTIQNQSSAIAVSRWDRMEFIGVSDDDLPVRLLLAQLQEEGSTVHRTPGLNTWRITLPGTWEEFLMVLSKPHRNRLRRADKNYFQSGLVQIRRAQTEDDVATWFDILVDLHQRNWQRRGMPGCFASEQFLALHGELSRRFFHDGRATLTWLEMEGKPLAVEYRLHGTDIMYAYQCGIDPERLKVQPGELANMASIRNAIERGQLAYDFLRGDEPYKAHWRAAPQPMFTIRVIPRRASSRLRHQAWLAGQNVKQWIKSGLELTRLRKSASSAHPQQSP
ncbi:MAG TPA: GNAT family N-acetyltransferase [Pirellulales bacterium]|nr:GNAT family N-acetyltransferase [Pirellulales bacterium]